MKSFPTFHNFATRLKWHGAVTSRAVENLELVSSYFQLKMGSCDEPSLSLLCEKMINEQLASGSVTNCDIVPFCIVALLLEKPVNGSDFLKLLHEAVSGGLDRKLSLAGTRSNCSGGQPCEDFVLAALKMRCLLSPVEQFPVTNWFRPCWNIPSTAEHCKQPAYFMFKAKDEIPATHVLFTYGVEALKSLLTPTLYQLFPIGCDDVADFVCSNNESLDTAQDIEVFAAFQKSSHRSPTTTTEHVRANLLYICLEADNPRADPFMLNPRQACRMIHLDRGSFPKNANQLSMTSVIEDLSQHLGQSTFVCPKNKNNEGCEWTIATLRDDPMGGKLLELIYVELKDRRTTRIDEIAKKLCAVTLDTWTDKCEIVAYCQQNNIRARQLLVIAGRCDDIFNVVTADVDECKKQRIKAQRC